MHRNRVTAQDYKAIILKYKSLTRKFQLNILKAILFTFQGHRWQRVTKFVRIWTPSISRPTLKWSGIDISDHSFTHCKFYITCSRMSSANDLYIYTYLAREVITEHINQYCRLNEILWIMVFFLWDICRCCMYPGEDPGLKFGGVGSSCPE